MWQKLMERHPVAFEVINWGVLGLSVVTFALAMASYLAVVS